MNETMAGNLHRAAVLTFEELGLIFASDRCGEQQRQAPVEAMVEVGFRGPHTGRVTVVVCGRVLPSIALNMLGDDGTPSQAQREEALKEIANVICGNVLPSLDGPDAEYRIDPPRVVDVPPSPHPGETSLVAKTLVGFDDGRAEVSLFIQARGALRIPVLRSPGEERS